MTSLINKIDPSRRLQVAQVVGLTGLAVALISAILSVFMDGAVAAHMVAVLAGVLALDQFTRRHLRRAAAEGGVEEASRAEKFSAWAVLLAGIFLLCLTRGLALAPVSGLALLVTYWLVKTFVGMPVYRAAGEVAAAKRHPIAETIGGLLAASMMFVVAYHYVLETFRIPTGSMEPTLYGHATWGDRVLVNKLSYEFGDPQRGDIAVIRFPLMRAVPYVKRPVGLPGELVLIAQGDLYIQKKGETYPHIWRKSGRLRESMWLSYFEFEGGEVALRANFRGLAGSAGADGDTIHLNNATLRFPREGSVRDRNPTDAKQTPSLYQRESVGDLRVSGTLSGALDSGDSMDITIKRGETAITFTWHDQTRSVRIEKPGRETREIDLASLETKAGYGPGETADFSFAVADSAIDITLDGHQLERIPLENEIEKFLQARAENGAPLDLTSVQGQERLASILPDRADCHVEIRGGGNVSISNLHIERDVHYLGSNVNVENPANGSWEMVPGPTLPYVHQLSDDGYFMLGDHSQNSADSRTWTVIEIEARGGKRYRMSVDSLFQGTGHDAVRLQRSWRGRIHNAIHRLPGAESLESLDGELTQALRAGAFGRQIMFVDIFGRRHEIHSAAIKHVTARHRPEVKRELFTGQLLASVFPKPRFPD